MLKDKAVLITGGDSGISRSVAVLMAREGVDVSIVYLPKGRMRRIQRRWLRRRGGGRI